MLGLIPSSPVVASLPWVYGERVGARGLSISWEDRQSVNLRPQGLGVDILRLFLWPSPWEPEASMSGSWHLPQQLRGLQTPAFPGSDNRGLPPHGMVFTVGGGPVWLPDTSILVQPQALRAGSFPHTVCQGPFAPGGLLAVAVGLAMPAWVTLGE